MSTGSALKAQLLPILVSTTLWLGFCFLTYVLLGWLNLSSLVRVKLPTSLTLWTVGLGVFIYLKTAVDYALFVGNLMSQNPGTKNRLLMNVGTQVGCFVGVTLILVLWAFFKELRWLMAGLLVLAAAVLFGLGDNSQDHFEGLPTWLKRPLEWFFQVTRPLVERLTFFMPDGELDPKPLFPWPLFLVSMIIPFALGADDLAGYLALLTPGDAFGLLVGIYLGDALIDMALFLKPSWTVRVVTNPWVSYLGAWFFVGLGALSLYDAVRLFI